MTAVASVFATLERLQYLLLEEGEEGRHSGSLQGMELVERKLLPKMRQLHKILADADSKRKEGKELPGVLDLQSKAKKLSSKIEDVVESYSLQVAPSSTDRRSAGLLKNIFKERCNLRSLIATNKLRASLGTLINEIDELCENFVPAPEAAGGLGESSSIAEDKSKTDKYLSSISRDDYVVGMEEDISLLVDILCDRGEVNYQVVSIKGMAGIGKTTLARMLYNHQDIRASFEGFAWVDVEWNTGDLFENIQQQVSQARGEELMQVHTEKVELGEQLLGILLERKCLVVLDDFPTYGYRDSWSYHDRWSLLRFAFLRSDSSSKVIIVTNRNAALTHFVPHFEHELRFLNQRKSWELFCKKMAPMSDTGNELPPLPKEIEPEIVRASGGLPLFIILLASMLRTKKESEWLAVCNHLPSWDLECFEERPADLLSSYYSLLPPRLKPCFLHLGNFPKYSNIRVDKLCQLWIAEGLISVEDRENNETMMEVAARYFGELVARSLLTVQGDDDQVLDVKLTTCKIHDLIRDLCISIGEAEQFLEVVNADSDLYVNRSAPRYAVHWSSYEVNYVINILRLRKASENLRSLLFLNENQKGSLWPLYHSNLFKDCRWLRVLDFDRIYFQDRKLPKEVGHLVYLRHLSFQNCNLEEFPSYLGNLPYLQILDLRVEKGCIMVISNVNRKLRRLRHLYFPFNCRTARDDDKLQLDGLKELEILENLDTDVCKSVDLPKLRKVRNLAVTTRGKVHDLENIFELIDINSNHLHRASLDVKNFDSYSEARLSWVEKLFKCPVIHTLRIEGHISKIPELDAISHRLIEILLNGSEIDIDPMPTLEKLPNLRILVLETEAYVGKTMHCSASGFPELRILKLSKLYNLESWKVDEGAMPKLSTLTIDKCLKLNSLPERFSSSSKSSTSSGGIKTLKLSKRPL